MVDLESILRDVADGECSPEAAAERIEGFTRVGDFARIDTDREDRVGHPEVVLGEGKTPEQVAAIAAEYLDASGRVLVTRADETTRSGLANLPAVTEGSATVEVHDRSNCVVLAAPDYDAPEPDGTVAVVTGGTSDLPVAEEAAVTARELGAAVDTHYDVGVAGVHRLLSEAESIADADCVVVAAGREGALPTVVAGLVDAPVIGLPVSVGYGKGGGGEAALLGMLQSCTVLSVVNVDAGFTAGAQAAKVARGSDGVE